MIRDSLEAYLQIKNKIKHSSVRDYVTLPLFVVCFLKTFLSSIPNIKVININGISAMHGLKNICVYALPFRKYFLRTYYTCCDVRTLLRVYITYTIPFLVYPYVVCPIINLLTINNSIMLKAVMYGPFYICMFLMMETSFFDLALFLQI